MSGRGSSKRPSITKVTLKRKPPIEKSKVFVTVEGSRIEVRNYANINITFPCFKAVWGIIEKTIDYDDLWTNRIPFDQAGVIPEIVGLKPGEYARSMDNVGRRVIFIGTQFGPARVFQVLSPDNSILGYEGPQQLRSGGWKTSLLDSAPEGKELLGIIGWDGGPVPGIDGIEIGRIPNIGHRVDFAKRLLTSPTITREELYASLPRIS